MRVAEAYFPYDWQIRKTVLVSGTTRSKGLTMRDYHLPGRSPVLATEGMCATSHPLAANAAIDIMKRGGNAMDAAIAGAVLGAGVGAGVCAVATTGSAASDAAAIRAVRVFILQISFGAT